MKRKTTRKELRGWFGTIISVGYCNLQSLLVDIDPAYYLTRAEGWAADAYIVDCNTIIVTGYAPFGNVSPEYDLQRKYELLARRAIGDGLHIDTENKLEKLAALRADFVRECLLADVLTKKEREIIKDNLAAFIVNFGVPRLVRADYGRGLFVYMGDSEQSIHFAYDINYLNGWLYGAVQAANRTKDFVMRGDKNELC